MDRKDAHSGECPKILPLSQFSSDTRCIINEGVVSYKGWKTVLVGVLVCVGMRENAVRRPRPLHQPPCTRDE